ncbi:MAG: hypothetical protein PHT64_07585 [Bacteroidales bacterium]|nr:hypothetical protein [Bacteroidales bacterium]
MKDHQAIVGAAAISINEKVVSTTRSGSLGKKKKASRPCGGNDCPLHAGKPRQKEKSFPTLWWKRLPVACREASA